MVMITWSSVGTWLWYLAVYVTLRILRPGCNWLWAAEAEWWRRVVNSEYSILTEEKTRCDRVSLCSWASEEGQFSELLSERTILWQVSKQTFNWMNHCWLHRLILNTNRFNNKPIHRVDSNQYMRYTEIYVKWPFQYIMLTDENCMCSLNLWF